MAQRLVTSFVNTTIPSAVVDINVISQPVGLGNTGVIVIIGEADGGANFRNVNLVNNVFTPDQSDKVAQMYISGPIVDAMYALSAPSNDSDITGTANQIYILKTNTSEQADAVLDTNYGTLSDQNYGVDGNLYKYQVVSVAAEVAPSYSGGTIPAFGAALNAASFSLRLEGGAAATVTLSGTAGDHSNVATLVVELNTLLPSGIVAAPGTATNSIMLTISPDAAAWRKGWGKSFELIDSTPGDLAALGLAAGLTVSSQEPAIELDDSRADINFSEALDVSADVALMVGYAGTTATLSINATTLSTTVAGGSGANLSIPLAQYSTIQSLADFINLQPGYSASAAPAAMSLPPSALDQVSAIGIASTGAGLEPGRVKDAAANFDKVLATSRALSFAPMANAGLPTPMASPAYLAGGDRGGTLAVDIIDAINALAGLNVNIIVPLFSQDASADIAAGVTDPSSTYTIAAIQTAVKNHCLQYSTPKLKKNRICVLSLMGSFAQAQAQAQSLASARCAMTMQQVMQLNAQGVITTFQPWYAACVAAGMQAGGFYKAIVNKYANVNSIVDPAGYDNGDPGDVEQALAAGLLVLTTDASGVRWVSDQTTYGFDANFVYNSMQAMYLADILALDLVASFQSAFVGKSLADVDAATALSYLAQKMDGYKKLKMIAASDDAPLGYKNPKVSILAPEMDVSVEVKLATAIYFVPISLSISQVQQTA